MKRFLSVKPIDFIIPGWVGMCCPERHIPQRGTVCRSGRDVPDGLTGVVGVSSAVGVPCPDRGAYPERGGVPCPVRSRAWLVTHVPRAAGVHVPIAVRVSSVVRVPCPERGGVQVPSVTSPRGGLCDTRCGSRRLTAPVWFAGEVYLAPTYPPAMALPH